MDRADVTTLLARGGLIPEDVARDQVRPARYNGLADPRGADALGRALAERLRDARPNRVLIWEPLEDIVLGYAVACDLECPVTRIVEHEGLLHVIGDLSTDDRVAIVADAFRRKDELSALLNVVRNNHATVAGVAALVATSALNDAVDRPITLVAADDVSQAPSDGPEASPEART